MTDIPEKPDRSELGLLTAGRDMWSTAELAGVPSVKMADGPMGIASGRVDERDISVLTPSGVALGASWDADLIRRVGALIGAEARKLGVNLMLAPNLNLPRSPLAGRAFEMYSEDPYLTGAIGAAWIIGVQSSGAGAVAKHLVCNDSETFRDRYNAIVDERTLREIYLKPFEMAVEAGCVGIMQAYNRVNGTYCVEHAGLLTDIVKQEWGFKGFTVCDWFGTKDTLRSANSGLDLEMPGPPRIFGPKFAAAVTDGQVDEARLNDAASRVASVAKALSGKSAAQFSDDEARALLTEAAAAGFVLLKNEGAVLPLLPGKHNRIAVIGPNAAAPCFQGGTFAKIAVYPDAVSPIDAIRARYAGQCEIVFQPGVDPTPRLPAMPVKPTRYLGDNDRGMTVEFFGSHDFTGQPLAAETRDTNSLTWFVEMPGIGALDKQAGIRASGIFTPSHSGTHSLYIGGTGALRLFVDGFGVFASDRVIAPSDIMGILKSGDAEHVDIVLEAGQAVTITAELRFNPARAQGLWYGVRAPGTPDRMLKDAVEAAKEADAVLLVVGETADSGVESKDRETTSLPDNQLELIEKICDANPNTVIAANVAHALDTTWADKAAAFMIVWFPGQEFGPALAEVIAGDREPGGRMPVTIAGSDAEYPVFSLAPDANGDLLYSEGLRLGYRAFAPSGPVPRHAFGAGFGYADFTYGGLEIDADGKSVELDLTNTSGHPGKEVVQVYIDVDKATAPRLAGFLSVQLDAGETKRVRVGLDAQAYAVWSVAVKRFLVSPVSYQITVGRSSADIRLQTSFTPVP